jgi:hypothetical protein
MKKTIRWIIGIIVIALVLIVVYTTYIGAVSEGWRSGLLQKFSRHGRWTHSYDGELATAGAGGSQQGGKGQSDYVWHFTVMEPELIEKIEKVQPTTPVKLYYKDKKNPQGLAADHLEKSLSKKE